VPRYISVPDRVRRLFRAVRHHVLHVADHRVFMVQVFQLPAVDGQVLSEHGGEH